MVKDEKEKSRKLTKAEERRLEHFEKMSADYIGKGYKRTELTVGVVFANVFGFLYGVPLLLLSIFLFVKLHPGDFMLDMSISGMMLFFGAMLILVVVHELIHGVSWGIFAEHHMKDIEFGFIAQYLTPYCACRCPLSKGKYIFGGLMPLVILGLIPIVLALIIASPAMLLMGNIMTISAAGDILVVLNILKYKSDAKDVVYIDHPTQAGGVIFER